MTTDDCWSTKFLKNLIDWLSRPIDPKDRKSPSVIRGKTAAICSVAGQSAGMNAQEKLTDLLKSIGVTIAVDNGFSHALGKEEFMTDTLILTEEEKMKLASQAGDLILNVGGF